MKIKIYSTSVIYRKILDKLPNNIVPLGVGNNDFPNHWLCEKSGKNINQLNKFYGEHSGIYWVWKNCMNEYNQDDWIGFCHYRKFWLNNFYKRKQKKSFENLFDNLLKNNNLIFQNNDVILVQPIIYRNKNLLEDFYSVHKTKILEDSSSFLSNDLKKDFLIHLSSNIMRFPEIWTMLQTIGEALQEAAIRLQVPAHKHVTAMATAR